MKKLILFILIPFFIACSDDDSSNNAGSFLDEYNGVIWLEDGNEENYDYWWIFTPNGSGGGERWYDSCDASYGEWGVSYDGWSMDVVENSSNRLVVSVIEDGDFGEVSYSITFTVSNNGNTLTAIYSDDPGYSEIFSRSDNSPC